jgi:Fe-S oxidoreductase
MESTETIIRKTKAYLCLDCGKCTSVCPVSLVDENYSPRVIVQKALVQAHDTLLKDELLWSCLSCGMCSEICESDVHYSEFTKDFRAHAYELGQQGIYTHDGMLHSIMRVMSSPDVSQNRLDWLTKDLKVKVYPGKSTAKESENSDKIVYFVGCLPYFDSVFSNLDVTTLDIARSTIKILNALGIEPILMANEKCCGHDLLWSGDVENFKKLALHNIEEIKKTGAKKIVFSCPEGYQIFTKEYPEHFGELGIEAVHISQLVAEKLPELEFRALKGKSRKLTYQDPCRLGRLCGIYEEPREMINRIQGAELTEMPKNRNNSICCGTSGWMNCGVHSKQIQLARLKEAKSTGAGLLVTNCPKCQIHFTCAMKDEDTPKDSKIEIKDLITLIADQLVF